jgi:hypothetical protein
MTTHVPLVHVGWLSDPVSQRAGYATTALVLVLAARAAASRRAGAPVVIPADVWAFYLDPLDADRATWAGLVEPPTDDGRRVTAWVLDQIDTEAALSRRLLTRDRVRRLRQRRRDVSTGQPSLSFGGESEETVETPINDLPCGKAVENRGALHPHVTHNGPRALYTRGRARPELPNKDPLGCQGVRAAKSVGQQEPPSPHPDAKRATFSLVLACVAATRRRSWAWRYPTTPVDRAALLAAVKTELLKAHLQPPDGSAIANAIALDEQNDVMYRAADEQTGTDGGDE